MLVEANFHNYFTTNKLDGFFKKFMRIHAYIGKAQQVGKHFVFYGYAEAGFVIANSPNPILDFSLGGWGNQKINQLSPFFGYNFFQLFGNSFIKLSGQIDYRFFKKAHLNFTFNTANIGNDIFLDDQWISRPRFNGVGIGLGYETLLGPVEMKYSYSPEVRNHMLWFSVGYKF